MEFRGGYEKDTQDNKEEQGFGCQQAMQERESGAGESSETAAVAAVSSDDAKTVFSLIKTKKECLIKMEAE
jgi:hypothetical protein